MKTRKNRILLRILLILLLAVLGFSVYNIISITRRYAQEDRVHKELLAYRPELPAGLDASIGSIPSGGSSPADPRDGSGAKEFANKSILQLQEDYPDAVGWITVPGTGVDYPFAQSRDNRYYLRRGLDGKYLYAGVPFLDYRCRPDFTSDNSIIYGHNLRNGSMFGGLEKFKQKEFFSEHDRFYVFLPHQTLVVEIAACLVVNPNQADYLYLTTPEADFPALLKQNARQFRDFTPDEHTRYVTLSTCDYEFDGGRVVLVGRVLD